MKRLFCLVCFTILILGITSLANAEESNLGIESSSEDWRAERLRITLDGTVYEADALIETKNKVYLKEETLSSLLGTDAKNCISINGISYGDIRQNAMQAGMNSVVLDLPLSSIYIWSDLTHESIEKNTYDLGISPSNSLITYKEFFSMLDAAVEIADASKLVEWKTMLPEARSSDQVMTRIEIVSAILYAACTLGDDYSDFNADWWEIEEQISDKVWDEIASITDHDPFALIPNPYPFDLNGFANSPFVFDGYWDLCSVALRYSYGRISNVSGKTLLDYDPDKQSIRPQDNMTVTEAIVTIGRFLDSKPAIGDHADPTNPVCTAYDPNIITPNLLQIANEMPEINEETASSLRGEVIGYFTEDLSLDTNRFARDTRKLSEWGFNSVRYMLLYQSLFSEDASTVNLTELYKLDQIVADAIRYHMHLNLTLQTVPGRWYDQNSEFSYRGEFDLFTNPQRQAEAVKVWKLLALRYRDIPNSVLSFSPLFEVMNQNLSSGLPSKHYSAEEAAEVFTLAVQTIRDADSDRLILCEGTPNNDLYNITQNEAVVWKSVSEKFDHVQLLTNFCETTYVYAEMTGDEGNNIDDMNHGMFKPSYPVTIYETGYEIRNGSPMKFDGVLPAGTCMKIYLTQTHLGGTFQATANGDVLYTEELTAMTYHTDGILSGMYPYAKSEKCIEIQLPKDSDTLNLDFSGSLTWSGIDIVLPQKYAVERWWYPSDYDQYLGTETETSARKIPTSTIQLSPIGHDPGTITIHEDVTYSSDKLYACSNRSTIQSWGNTISNFAPGSVTRIESARFSIGTDYESMLAYYGDILEMCDQYGIGWYQNDYYVDTLLGREPTLNNLVGLERISCDGGYAAKELLELIRQYLDPPILLE